MYRINLHSNSSGDITTFPFPMRAKSLAAKCYQYTQYISVQVFFHPALKAEFATTHVPEYPIIIVPFTSLARLEMNDNKRVLHCFIILDILLVSIPALKSQHAWNVRCPSLSVCLTWYIGAPFGEPYRHIVNIFNHVQSFCNVVGLQIECQAFRMLSITLPTGWSE